MDVCDTCGNSYDSPMTITQNGSSGVFDSFECAIHAMAPSCGTCSVRIIGHGRKSDGVVYCCDHCVPG